MPTAEPPGDPGRDATRGRRLRLAFVGDASSPHLRRWIGWFLDRGHEVHLVQPAGDQLRSAPDPRIVLHASPSSSVTRVRGIGSILTAVGIRRALAGVRPDVLHAHALWRYGFAAWLSGFHPLAITVWGSDVLVVLPTSPRLRLQGRLALRSADLVTAGSEHLRAAVIAAGARADRTTFIHFGVDTKRFAPGPAPVALRARLGLDGYRVVLSQRAVTPIYRQRVVLEAFARLQDDTLLVLSRHRAQAEELAAIERRAVELGVERRIRVLPELADADMPDLYRAADVVVSVPASDGGPITLVEALAAGRPVVASDIPSVREWLGEVDPESLVPVDDPVATAEAIRRVLDRSDADRADRASRGRRLVEERADWDANMRRMEELYRRLAARQPVLA